jgi:hypothetical protein
MTLCNRCPGIKQILYDDDTAPNRKTTTINDKIRNSWTSQSWHDDEENAKENVVIHDVRGASHLRKPATGPN